MIGRGGLCLAANLLPSPQSFTRGLLEMRIRSAKEWLFTCLLCVLASDLQTARADDFYVNPIGGSGVYTTIQSAMDAVPAGTPSNRTNIFVAPGVYPEFAPLPAPQNLRIKKPYVSLIGTGSSPEDVVIQSSMGGLDGATRIYSSANDFMATNLTFQNTKLDGTGVGVALRNAADRSAFKNVRILGFQDTLLAENKTRQYYVESYITGDTDFIFGNATAVFDNSVINSSDGGHITAAETFPNTAIGFVFLNSMLTTNGAGDNSTDLGRPWHWPASQGGTRASVTYINVKMDAHILAGGWDPWNSAQSGGNPDPDGTTRYSEFNTMDLAGNALAVDGNGVPVGRVSWADPMTAQQADAYTLENIFAGPGFWNDNPDLQPEYVGGPAGYTNQLGIAAWNPLDSLAQLPIVPEPSSFMLIIVATQGGLLARRRTRRQ